MYSCSDVAKWIASDEYKSAGFLRRLGIRLHLLLCKYCLRYQRQLEALAKGVRKRACELPPSAVESAKKRILDELCRKS